jgi:hypothetical protein
MPSPVLIIFGALFKVRNHKLFTNSVEDLEELLQPFEVEKHAPTEEQLPQPTQGERHSSISNSLNRNHRGTV